jgi:hypothetical protein
MTFIDSGRRPGLGGALLSVYGITRDWRIIPGIPVSGNSKDFLRRAVDAIKKRIRPRS